jgi:hypothetical protein
MQESDESGVIQFEIIAKKSVKGIFALTSRTFLIQILSIVTSVILSIYLSPATFWSILCRVCNCCISKIFSRYWSCREFNSEEEGADSY